MLEAASGTQPRTAATAEEVVRALQRAAEAEAEAAGEGPSGRREQMRTLLSEVIRCLSVEARDVAATQPSPSFQELSPDAGVVLLEDLGPLAAAVPSNVTPSVVVLEAIRRLRGPLGPSGLRSHSSESES
jgi:hypothetical protein